LNKNEIIGKNPDLLTTVYQASIVAKVDVPVMIRGENGVGKEIIAKFIHRCSSRAHKPLITVNCAAIPENLIESELFGYEEGSFTGAKRGGKVGKFEMADGGTLFLDEIGDMPLNMQTKLLRAIQESEIEKVGSSNNVSVDVRIITATNQPLEEMIEKKLFRKDLYYRINTVSLTIPPVRDRKEDIVLLADYFLKKFNKKYNKSVMFSNDVLAFFSSYSWPGNVRELKNCIEYGVIMCQNNRFDKTYLSQHMQDEKIEPQAAFIEETVPPFTERTLKEALDMVEKNVIQDTLAACGNNKAEAMRMLGLSRRTFYRHLQKHNINTK